MGQTERYRTVTALVSAAAILAWMGVHSLASSLGIAFVSPELYLATQLVSAAVLTWAAWMPVSAGDIHLGTVPMMLGLSVITGIYSALMGGHDSASVLRMSFILPLIVPAALMWADGLKPLALGTVLLAASFPAVFASGALSGILLVLSGALLAASAFRCDAPAERDPAKACRMLLLGLIAVHSQVMLLSEGMLLGSYMGVTVSAAIAVVSASMFGHGMVMAGCSGILYAFIGLMAGVPLAENSTDITIIPLVNAACVAVGAMAFIGREKALGAGMAVFGAALTAWSFDGPQWIPASGAGILSALCLAEDVRTWKGLGPAGHELEGLGRIAGVASSGLMVLSLSLVSNSVVQLTCGAYTSLNQITVVGCAFMVGFSLMAVRGRMLTEAMVFLLAACVLFIYPLSDIMADPNDLMPTSIAVCIGFAVASYIFWRMKAPMRSAGCAMIVASLLIAGTGAGGAVRTVPMATAGLLFLAVSLKKAYRFGVTSDAKIEERANLVQSDDQYATVLMALATFILMILALISEMSGLLHIKSWSLSAFRLMLLSAIMGFGLYSMRKGSTALGTYLLGSFLICMLIASLHLAGMHMPMELNILSSVLFVPAVAAFHASGNRMMTAISFLMLLSVVAEPLLPSTWAFDMVVLAFKTASGLAALTMWIEYDVGWVVIPKYSGLWRKDPKAESPARPVPPCILFTCLMLASVMALWAAAGPFIAEPVIDGYYIAAGASALLCIVASASLFHAGSPDWGALLMLLSIGILSSSVSGLTDQNGEVEAAVCLPLAVLAAAGLVRGSRAVPALGIAAVAAFILMDAVPEAGSAAIAAVGIAMAALGSRGMITGRSWVAPSGLGGGWAVAMAAAVGLCICIHGTNGMLAASLAASVFAMMAGFGCGSQGRHADCLALLSASVPGFTASATALMGAELSAVPLVIPAALMAASAAMYHAAGRDIGTLLCAIGAFLALASIATGSWMPAAVGCGTACLAAMLSGIGSEHPAAPEDGAAAG